VARITYAELPDDLPVKNNLVRSTFTNPDMHRGFASLSGRVHSTSHLPSRTRELVVLRIAGKLGAEYEWQQHEPQARFAGVTDDELTALRTGDLDVFDGAERAAVRFATHVEDRTVDDQAWSAAREHFSEVELVDIALLAGFYGLASRFVLAFDVDLEAPRA
jgi:4-carboxymuconolactone decarboxylase